MGGFWRNNALWIGAVLTILGLVLVLLSYLTYFNLAELAWYRELVCPTHGQACKDWNLWVMVVSPFVLLAGAWNVGEQVVLRRRFDEAIDVRRRREFVQSRSDLEDWARRLPDRYRDRLQEKEAEMKSR